MDSLSSADKKGESYTFGKRGYQPKSLNLKQYIQEINI